MAYGLCVSGFEEVLLGCCRKSFDFEDTLETRNNDTYNAQRSMCLIADPGTGARAQMWAGAHAGAQAGAWAGAEAGAGVGGQGHQQRQGQRQGQRSSCLLRTDGVGGDRGIDRRWAGAGHGLRRISPVVCQAPPRPPASFPTHSGKLRHDSSSRARGYVSTSISSLRAGCPMHA